ncbi:NCS2 family nucleobase:cation symporter-2 [Actinobaculum suis]|uniref:NCS2 family nucleobase:cation symporter-2 n=1 Tax=Actinobaculum suis TaxID=1657 RepID=A0A7Z8Y7S4_9ACTO|nr:NCS2 family permease [Actinobaculum suis]VDG75761.1 NCS2 family nucleobase:cation symporter-2 [Actinobaculum suis]
MTAKTQVENTSAPDASSAPTKSSGILGYFKVKERGSTVARELRGGLVTFVAMVYILVLNPIILSGPDSTGMYLGGGTEPNMPAIAAGTALVAGVMTILMGAVANFPMAMAAGLGLNTLVGAVIVQIPGMTWADGMGIIVLEGIVITLLVLTGLREAIFRAVPKFLRTAISVGLGLFITLVGLTNAGIVSGNAEGGTILNFGINGSVSSWPFLVFVIGLLVTFVCIARKVSGALLIGIVTSTVLAVIVEQVARPGLRADGVVTGWSGSAPVLSGSPIQIPDFATLGEFSIVGPFQKIGVIAVVVLTFSVMLADFFDTMGTMVAVGREGNLLDEEGQPEGTSRVLLIDSLSALAGGMGGVSSNTSFVESTTGVADGARTGLASITTGVLFLLSMFFAPLVTLVPSEAAAPSLVAVGLLMLDGVIEINWEDRLEAVPAFMTIVFMPFAYSVTVGIGVGFIFYVLMAVFMGKARQIKPLMWVSAVLFVIYFLLDPLQRLLGI